WSSCPRRRRRPRKRPGRPSSPRPRRRGPFEGEIQNIRPRFDFSDQTALGVVLLGDDRHLLIDHFRRDGGVSYLSIYRDGAPDLDRVPARPQALLDLILTLVDPPPAARPRGPVDRLQRDRPPGE